ncbi:MAG: ion transporter [Akkermansiaceae bacterium]|jgi:voltage-gated sodium channel
MSKFELMELKQRLGLTGWRLALAKWVDSGRVQSLIIILILANAVVLGLETSPTIMAQWGGALVAFDHFCLGVFILELVLKFLAYRLAFWKSGWNVFDLVVVAVAIVPGAGPWAVLRSLRVLRVLRLLTVIPALRKVVAAFLHSIPGLAGVVAWWR